MDLQEMNDMTEPVIQQKDLEAEALRLQIQLRDQVIDSNNQMLSTEQHEMLEKPRGWLDMAAMIAKAKRPAPVPRQFTDDLIDGAPDGCGSVSVADLGSAGSRGRPALPPLVPARGRA